jgi:hypothetical protein
MPTYQCRFFNESDEIVRVEVLGSSDDREARREARILMARAGNFAGYELLEDGRKFDAYRPIK